LERVTLASDVDQMKDVPRLVMMTVHGAKGLEFRAVFLTGMEDEIFPYKRQGSGEIEEIEEERRLAYVALTRAREWLTITHAAARTLFGQARYGCPSRFLATLPPGDVEGLSTRPAPTTSFVDRPSWSRVPSGEALPARPWRHPLAEKPKVEPGERYVDSTAFDDIAPGDGLAGLRQGARVRHARFGEGEVRRVERAAEIMVVAFFPGWGEKKILARFLESAS
jgi:DNA helicase-2/ATP-dependent DNA helicase PcrA